MLASLFNPVFYFKNVNFVKKPEIFLQKCYFQRVSYLKNRKNNVSLFFQPSGFYIRLFTEKG